MYNERIFLIWFDLIAIPNSNSLLTIVGPTGGIYTKYTSIVCREECGERNMAVTIDNCFTTKYGFTNIVLLYNLHIYIIMWSCPGNFGRVICLSDLGNILAYYLDKTTLISLLYWVSNCPGNMPKYYSTKYHYRNLHEV